MKVGLGLPWRGSQDTVYGLPLEIHALLQRKNIKKASSANRIHTPHSPTLYRWSPAWSPKFLQALCLLIAAWQAVVAGILSHTLYGKIKGGYFQFRAQVPRSQSLPSFSACQCGAGWISPNISWTLATALEQVLESLLSFI